MADFGAPSFSLGFDFSLFDSEPQISTSSFTRNTSSSDQFSVAAATTVEENDDDVETLIVDDSEPEYLDQHTELKRLRRVLTVGATSLPIPANADTELHSTAVIDDGCDDHQYVVFPELAVIAIRGFKLIDSGSGSDDPCVSKKCNGYESCSNQQKSDLPQHVGLSKKRKFIESVELSATGSPCGHFSPAHHYFFHDDPRIQELVRSRLPNFSPLDNKPNRDFEKPCTSKIDYMGQFRCGESSKDVANKSLSRRRNSKNSKTEEMSEGWVNPKLGVKVATKGVAKRNVHGAHQTPGRWLTGSDGKKVYVGIKGQELTGRVAYWQYTKESGTGFKKAKRKSATKKKK